MKKIVLLILFLTGLFVRIVQAQTDPPTGCSLSYVLSDSYGDGWNGAAILVYNNSNVLIETWTFDNGYSSNGTLSVNDGENIHFVWQEGFYDGESDGECSFEIYDPEGELILSGTGGLNTSSSNEYLVDCPSCYRPTNLSVEYTPGSTTARVTWNGNANSYHIYVNVGSSELEYNTNNTFYDLTGLVLEQEYSISVASVCGIDDESIYAAITFTPTSMFQIGSGSSTVISLPTSTSDNYSLSEQIYTSDELGGEGTILSIGFYMSGSEDCSRDLDIYMVSTHENSFNNNGDWVPVTHGDLVYSGSVYFNGDEWSTITLTNNFEYDGESNVAIVVNDHTGSFNASGNEFLSFNAPFHQAVYLANYYNSFDPTGDLSSFNHIYKYEKNQIRILKNPPACPKPLGLTVNTVTPTSATLSWTQVGTPGSWEICLNGDEDHLIVVDNSDANTNTYRLTGLIPEGSYTIKVRAKCGTDVHSQWSRPVAFVASNLVAIGTEEGSSDHLPACFNSSYSMTGQIYTANELRGQGTILSISFNSTNDFQYGEITRSCEVFMKSTSLEGFQEKSDWITVTDEDLVFSGSVTFPPSGTWVDIDLDTPFNYDGNSNVFIVIKSVGTVGDGYEVSDISDMTCGTFTNDANIYQSINYCAENDYWTEGYNSYPTVFDYYRYANLNAEKNQIHILKVICPEPSRLMASDVTETSATLSWTERGTAQSWDIEYSTSIDFPENDQDNPTVLMDDVSTSTILLENLASNTKYYVRVKSNCGEEANWSAPYSFATACGNQDRCEIFYELFAELLPVHSGGWNGAAIRVIDADNEIVLDRWTISEDSPSSETDNTTYARGSLSVCSGRNIRFEWEGSPEPESEFDRYYSFVVYDADYHIIFSGTGAVDEVKGSGYDIKNEEEENNYRLLYETSILCTQTDCSRPSDVVVEYEGGTSAEVRWDGEADLYIVSINGTQCTTSTTSYTFENLFLGTHYTVQVQAICTNGESHWSRPVSFTTDLCLPENQCSISYELHDSYGDGWNGASIKVIAVNSTDHTETVIATWTIPSNDNWGEKSREAKETDDGTYISGTLAVCDMSEIMFKWYPGLCDYECSFEIYDWSGATIVSGNALDFIEVPPDYYGHEGWDIMAPMNVNCSAVGMAENGWNAISAYTQGGYNITVGNPLISGNYDLYRYDEPSASWQNYKANNYNLETGRGYIYRRANYASIDFGGTANTNDLEEVQHLTASCTTDVNLKGFNLIGNPYKKTIYKGVNFLSGNLASGFYSLECDGSWRVHPDDAPIGIGKGVLVKVSGENPVDLSFIYNPAKTCENGMTEERIKFSIEGCGHEDVAYAIFNSEFTKTDAEGLPKIAHLSTEAPSLSIPQRGTDYAIAMIASGTHAFPLKFRADRVGEYTLDVTGDVSGLGYLHLVDCFTGAEIDLLSQPTYSFMHSRNQLIAQRFIVKLTPIADDMDNGLFAYQNGDILLIKGTGMLQIYDMMGRQLYASELKTGNTQLPTNLFPTTGVYIIRLGDKSQKLVIK